MINNSVWLIAFPDKDCRIERVDLKVLMKRAIRIEERMRKGVNLQDEQKRYHTLCDRIEYYGHMIAQYSDSELVELGTEYLDQLRTLYDFSPEDVRQARLTADFCPSDLVGEYLDSFRSLLEKYNLINDPCFQKKVQFYKKAYENGYNIIELHQPGSDNGESLVSIPDPDDIRDQFLSLKTSDRVSVSTDNAYVGLRNQIFDVIKSVNEGGQAAVNFSDLGHYVISEILNEFVYGRGRKLYLPVRYGDGSMAQPFPIFCLRPRQPEAITFAFKDTPVLHVGQMSQRHTEMDPKVQIYFFRNQEVSIGRNGAETDTTAYLKAKEMFEHMRRDGKYQIAYYQTGFQPAIVGFYRALTEELIFRSTSLPTLQVTPYYFLGQEYKAGKVWN